MEVLQRRFGKWKLLVKSQSLSLCRRIFDNWRLRALEIKHIRLYLGPYILTKLLNRLEMKRRLLRWRINFSLKPKFISQVQTSIYFHRWMDSTNFYEKLRPNFDAWRRITMKSQISHLKASSVEMCCKLSDQKEILQSMLCHSIEKSVDDQNFHETLQHSLNSKLNNLEIESTLIEDELREMKKREDDDSNPKILIKIVSSSKKQKKGKRNQKRRRREDVEIHR